jgi:hypothetical protein
MTVDIATLGLAVDSRPVARAREELGRFTASAGQAEGATGRLGSATDALAGMYKKLAAAYAAYKVADHIRESAMLAARYETMGVVMRVAGNNAGYTNAKMLELQKQLQTTGISMLQSRDALTQLSTAHIDLSKATDLARIAQNLAVVANVNSSEALASLIHGIKSGQSDMLHNLGLQVSFEAAYKAQAIALHTTTEKLTEHQKMVARTNLVMKEAAAYNGIYEESLTTAGKQLSSLKRYFEDLKVKAGEVFLPVLTKQVEDLTKALKAANAEVDRQGGKEGNFEKIGAALLLVYDKMSRATVKVGATLSGILVGLGDQIQGFGNAAKLLASGEFSKAWDAWQAGLQKSKNASDQARAFNDALTKANKTAKQSAEQQAEADKKAKEAADAKEKARIEKGKKDQADKEAEEKRAQIQEEADKKAKEAAKQMQEHYKELIKTIGEKEAAERIALATEGQLTDGQEYAAKIMDDLRTGVLKLSDAEKRRLAVSLEAYLLAEKARKEAEEQRKADEERLATATKEIQDISDANAKLKEQIQNYGLSTQQINLNTIAKLNNQMQDPHRDDVEIAAMEAKVLLLQEQNRLLNDLKVKDDAAAANEAIKKANDQAMQDRVEQAKRTSETIDKTFHDGFVAMLGQGHNAWTSWTRGLATTFKASVADEIYKMFAKPLVIRLIANMTGLNVSSLGGLGSVGSSGGTSGANSLIGNAQSAASLYNAGKTLYAGFQSGVVGSIGSGISTLGSMFGSSSASAYGAGVYGSSLSGPMSTYAADTFGAMGMTSEAGAATAGMSAGTYAIPIAGWIMAGMALSNKLYGAGWDADNGTMKDPLKLSGGSQIFNNILKGIGLSDSTANMFSGMSTYSKILGRKNPKIEQSGLEGTFNATGFKGDMYANIVEQGGWLRSDKHYTKTADVDVGLNSALSDTIQNLLSAVKGFGTQLGVETTQIDGYTKDIKLQLTQDDAKNQQLIAEMFAGIGDELATKLVPTIAEFKHTGETAATTLARLSDEFKATDQAAKMLGTSAEVLFGSKGLDSAKARERLMSLSGGMDALATNAAAYAESFMTDAERLVPVQKALADAMASLGYASVTTREDFKATVDGLIASGAAGTEEGAKSLAGLLALTSAFNQVHPAAEAAAASVKAVADALKEAASALFQDVDNAYSALEAVVGREKKILEDRLAAEQAVVDKLQGLSDNLHGTLLNMQASGTEATTRAAAQAQIREALNTVKSGGPLPNLADIQGAISAASKTSTDGFSTYEDYMRDFYRTQGDIAALADYTDDQLGVAKATLKATQDQISYLDKLLEQAKEQVDQAKGLNTTLLTVSDALAGLQSAIAGLKYNPVAGGTSAINQAYQSALGRAPDTQGLTYWQDRLATGSSQETVVNEITNSVEAKLQGMYKDLLGRRADAEGLAFWMNAAASGVSLDRIRQDIINSSEHRALQGFASGGSTSGGLSAVGEHGFEVVATGAARVWSNRQVRDMIGQDRLETLVQELVSEVRELRAEQRAGDAANVLATKDQTKLFRNMTDDGTALLTKAAT